MPLKSACPRGPRLEQSGVATAAVPALVNLGDWMSQVRAVWARRSVGGKGANLRARNVRADSQDQSPAWSPPPQPVLVAHPKAARTIFSEPRRILPAPQPHRRP